MNFFTRLVKETDQIEHKKEMLKLEIEKVDLSKVGIKFGVIGIGQGGGRIADVFARIGYPAMAINTSRADLNKLNFIPDENRVYIGIGKGDGAQKDLRKGKEAVLRNIDPIVNKIDEIFTNENTDMFLVTAGMGGGTGSGGTAVVLSILNKFRPQVPVATILTLPLGIEGIKVKATAVKTLEEITKLNKLAAMFIVDNDKIESTSILSTFDYINEEIVASLHHINHLVTLPADRTFDSSELTSAFSTRGLAMVTGLELELEQLKDPVALAELIKLNWRSSVFANTDYSRAIVSGICFELPPGVEAEYLSLDTVKAFRQQLTTNFDINLGIYENSELEKKAKIYTVLAGLPMPEESLKERRIELADHQGIIREIFQESEEAFSDTTTNDFLNEFVFASKKALAATVENPETDLDKMLQEFAESRKQQT